MTDQPWKNIPATGPLLRPSEAARYLGYKATASYYNLAAKGLAPRPLKVGVDGAAASGIPKPWLDALIAAAAA